MVSGGERASYQHIGNEGSNSDLEHFPWQAHKRVGHSHEHQHHSCGVSEEAMGHHLEGVVCSGTRVVMWLGGSFSSSHGKIDSGEEQHSSKSAESPRPGLFFLWFSMWFVRPSVTLILTCLLQEHTQSQCRACLLFHIPWQGNRMPFNIPGMISLFLPPPPPPHPQSRSSSLGVIESGAFDEFILSSSCSFLASKGVVCWSVISSGGRTSRPLLAVEPVGSAPHQEVSSRFLSCKETIKHLIRKAGFLEEVAEVVASDLRVPQQHSVKESGSFFFCKERWCYRFLLLRVTMLLLTISFHWLVLIWPPTASLGGCSLALRSFVSHERLSHRNGTCLWFFRALLIHLISPVSCPLINTLPGRSVFCFLSLWPRRLVSCAALHFMSHLWDWRSCTSSYRLDLVTNSESICALTLDLMSSPFPHWMILCVWGGGGW